MVRGERGGEGGKVEAREDKWGWGGRGVGRKRGGEGGRGVGRKRGGEGGCLTLPEEDDS